MARVLVTGGAGFIASHVVDGFIAAGNQVLIVDDLSSGVKSNVSAKASLLELDIRSEKLGPAIKEFQPEIVVHAAAQMSVRRSMDEPVFDVDVNVVGLLNILQSLKGFALPHFVFTSTGGAIYGEQDTFPAKEDHRVSPESVYGLSKKVSELYLDLWARVYGLRFGVVRLANVYGPRQNPHGEAGVVAIFNQVLISGKTPTINGSGEQTRDFVFVGDVAKAILAVAEKRVTGIYNIGTGQETSVNQVYGLTCEALGLKRPAAYAAAKVGEQLRSCIDASLARNKFGWVPSVSVKEGLRQTSEWFRQTASAK